MGCHYERLEHCDNKKYLLLFVSDPPFRIIRAFITKIMMFYVRCCDSNTTKQKKKAWSPSIWREPAKFGRFFLNSFWGISQKSNQILLRNIAENIVPPCLCKTLYRQVFFSASEMHRQQGWCQWHHPIFDANLIIQMKTVSLKGETVSNVRFQKQQGEVLSLKLTNFTCKIRVQLRGRRDIRLLPGGHFPFS